MQTVKQLFALLLLALPLTAQVIQDPPFGKPDAVVDLASTEGVQLVKGQWRYHDVQIVDAESKSVGPDLRPTGTQTIKTYDYTPHAGIANFDDSQWEAIDATTLDQRRSTSQDLLQLVSHQRDDPEKSCQLLNRRFNGRIRNRHR